MSNLAEESWLNSDPETPIAIPLLSISALLMPRQLLIHIYIVHILLLADSMYIMYQLIKCPNSELAYKIACINHASCDQLSWDDNYISQAWIALFHCPVILMLVPWSQHVQNHDRDPINSLDARCIPQKAPFMIKKDHGTQQHESDPSLQ